jgi:DNA-directed RNA polymerase subunit RPC12/RpoP
MITETKPWRCLNCKRRAGDEEIRCGGCGDRLKAAPKRLS